MNMLSNSRLLATICTTAAFISLSANAAAYSFSVDHFRVVGNLPGDVSDDFNDGSIAPSWEIFEPTVVESGGMLTFSNPGTIVTPIQIGGQSILSSEMSYIGSNSTGSLQMQNGSGDFLGASTWSPAIPDSNQFYTMGINDVVTDEDFSIGVYNFGTALASAFGVPEGVGVFFGRFGDVGTGDFDVQGVSLVPADITGNIILSLSFIDATDLFSGAFSLDGGTTFFSPYTSIATGSGVHELGWYLGAESFTVPIPAAVWLFASGITGLIGIARLRIA
jgi:hypothetical protein